MPAVRPNALVRSLPHVLTTSRLVLVAFTYTVVPDGPRPLFVALVLLAVATDMVDGPLARRLGVASKWGANFDSVADLAFYASLVVWGYLYEPDVLVPLSPLLVLLVGFYLTTLVWARLKRGVLGFHNRWSRLSATFGVVFGLYLVGWGWNVLLAALLVASIVADLWQRVRVLMGRPLRPRPWHA